MPSLREPAPSVVQREAGVLVAAAGAGLPGLLPGAGGALDPLALLSWLALVAPAVGAAVGACPRSLRGAGLAATLRALAVPAAWTLLLVWADPASARDLPAPAWGAAVVAGLFAGGLGLGSLLSAPPWAPSGALLLVGLMLAGAGVQGGLARHDASWARTHPRLQALLVDVSPLVLATEAAGWDWIHAQPEAYALSGVEWFPRRPFRGPLAGATSLVVGCAFAALASRRSGRVPKERTRR